MEDSMFPGRFLSSIALVALSGSAGFLLSEQWRATADIAASPVADQVAAHPQVAAETQAAVTLFGDGTVTINVQKRPLRWLLEEIERQGGGKAAGSLQTPGAQPRDTSPVLTTCNETSPAPEVSDREQTQALQAIREGNENARYEALLMAKSSGAAVPEETLKSLFETDASERVRLLAFENYLEGKSASPEEMRAALQAALYNPSGTIQTEAKKLLEQLEELERADAANPQLGAQ
jgi:hypothetical protein